MTIKRNFYFLFLLLFCLNSVALAQSDVTKEQVDAWVKVGSARDDYQDANDHLLALKIDKNTAVLDLAQKKYAQGDNREQYIQNIAGIVSGIGLDPLDIASNAAVEIGLLIGNIAQSVSLDEAVRKAEEVLSKVDGIIYTYANEASHRKTYYEGLKKAYEDNYGPIDPNAKPQLPPSNFCVRGDACTMKALSNPANPEEHQRSCPHKIDGWFFGLGERNCSGYFYICDSSYQCSRWEEHLHDRQCGHRTPNRDIDQHKMLTPGPCGDNHYACDKSHHGKQLPCGVHYEYKCSPLTATQKTDHSRYVSCSYCNYYGTLCQIPFPCMGNPSPGGYHNLR